MLVCSEVPGLLPAPEPSGSDRAAPTPSWVNQYPGTGGPPDDGDSCCMVPDGTGKTIIAKQVSGVGPVYVR